VPRDVREIEPDEYEETFERVAAVDVAKASAKVCTRVAHPSVARRRVTKVWDVSSTTNAIMALADELADARIERVVIESTSDYWRPFFYLLEARGLVVWLVNARDVKQVPGRPKTDKLDAVWLAKLNERGMLRPSFVPPKEIRELRDYTRLRVDLTQERGRYAATLGLTGRFDDHHGELARILLDQIDALREKIETLTLRVSELIEAIPGAQVEERSGPAAPLDPERAPLQVIERLDEVTGIGLLNAQAIIAEIGLNMGQFPSPGRLVSWAKLSPRTIQSGPKTRSGKTGQGNPYLRRALSEAAAAAARTDTFLGERYRRLVKRRGKLRALVAVARSILVIVWHLFADRTARFIDLGPGFYDRRINNDRRTRDLIRQLQALGHQVTLRPAA